MSITRYSIPQIEDLEPDSYGDWVPYDEYEDLEVELEAIKERMERYSNEAVTKKLIKVSNLIGEFTEKLCALRADLEGETNES